VVADKQMARSLPTDAVGAGAIDRPGRESEARMHDHDRRVATVSPFLLLLALAAGCLGRSEASVRAEFNAYVAGANACSVPTDCAIAYADCPLGCVVSVRTDRKADVEAKARALVADYQRGGQSCQYDCVGPVATTCAGGRCGFAIIDSSPSADADADADAD
jgi:hypothetical protein